VTETSPKKNLGFRPRAICDSKVCQKRIGYAVGSKCWRCGHEIYKPIRYLKRFCTWGFITLLIASFFQKTTHQICLNYGGCYEVRDFSRAIFMAKLFAAYIGIRLMYRWLSDSGRERRRLQTQWLENQRKSEHFAHSQRVNAEQKRRAEFLGRMSEVERAQFLHNERMETLLEEQIGQARDMERRRMAAMFFIMRNNQRR
jgi:hypothetical protein